MTTRYLSDMFSLEGKSVIVTGGTGGLGSAMVEALAKAGASPIVSIELPGDPLSGDLAKKVEELGSKIMVFPCDLGSSEDLRACYQKIWDAGVVPDILLNCAGVMRRNLAVDATDNELSLLFDVNAKSYYVSMQEFGRRVISLDRPGKVINIGSATSYLAGFNTSVYSSTKGAVMQMTKAFSNEWASKGIMVNCIAPGFMHTSMTAKYREEPKMMDYIMMRVPIQRWGNPDEMSAAVLFLAAPSNTFVSGICMPVDGGFCGK